MDEVETLLIDVRAATRGFEEDLARLRGSVDGTLGPSFERAGRTLEASLAQALRRGALGFDDLKRVALSVLGEIASAAIRSGIGAAAGGGGEGAGGGLLSGLSAIATAALGLPGRATGGPVAPGRAFLVGERGPEVFVPTASGRVEPLGRQPARDVRVTVNVAGDGRGSPPQQLERSARQVARAVRRALAED